MVGARFGTLVGEAGTGCPLGIRGAPAVLVVLGGGGRRCRHRLDEEILVRHLRFIGPVEHEVEGAVVLFRCRAVDSSLPGLSRRVDVVHRSPARVGEPLQALGDLALHHDADPLLFLVG